MLVMTLDSLALPLGTMGLRLGFGCESAKRLKSHPLLSLLTYARLPETKFDK